MKKPFLIGFVLSLLPMAVGAIDFSIDGLEYSVLENYDSYLPEDIVELTDGKQFTDKNLIVPSSVTYEGVDYIVVRIGTNAFEGNTNIETVVLPEGMREIWSGAFRGCKSIASVKFPSSLKDIFRQAFKGCNRLEEVILPDNMGAIRMEAFSGCSHLKSFVFPKHLIVLETYELLANCSSLEEVVCPPLFVSSYYGDGPDGYPRVADYPYYYRRTFVNCSNLREVTLSSCPEALFQRMSFDNVFEGCKRLEKITFDDVKCISFTEQIDGLRIIEFKSCEDLRLGFNQFNLEGCPSLEKIILSSEIPPKCDELVCTEEQFQNVMVIVPDGAVEAYAQADGWSHFLNINSASDPSSVGSVKMTNLQADTPYNNLNGIRVAQPKKDVYIKNGKKIIVK